ncbi:DUF1269 domain-containing protein [Salsipaludibacter albus]|uniref:DUF1269 domain-containing protein n=1 Tax=Salsipaludibacter albus TaxID=2849650 RepID=UPI001EE42285|nr:DUF1269 domain-containing protein [Salsipaludibacter albus]MBY5161325.1 DUF1269 domain-containing protein [Salsipaludibacter albus]
MALDNLVLYVATYTDESDARTDYDALHDAQRSTDLMVLSAVVLSRDDDGEVTVDQHGTGEVATGTVSGGLVGLAVGLFAPPLLLATAAGAGIGAGIGALMKRHHENELSVDLQDSLPPGSSAVVVVLEDTYLDRVDKALAKSAKKVDRAIDAGDYDRLAKELEDAGHRIDDAVQS